MQLTKSLSNPDHPFHGFSTGNLQTLRDDPLSRGVKIRDEFIRFHTEQYSANRMKLVVLGRESLDTLQGWVEGLFKDVVNKSLKPNRWPDTTWATPKELRKLVFAKPVMEKRSLKINFPFIEEKHLFEEQPGRYLSHLIGHEGPGSILACLKAKGWVDGLSAGSWDVCPGSPGMMSISISLTNDGLANYKEVTHVLFEYLGILHETPPQEWIFEEMKKMAEVDFKFKQKGSASRTTSALAEALQEPIPRQRLLTGESMPVKFDAAVINEAISWLKADNVHLTVVTPDELPGEVKNEKWYGTEYSEQYIPKDFMDELRSAEKLSPAERISDLHLPHKNEFIPSRLTVDKKEVEQPAKTPKLIRHEPNLRLWYKRDDQFWVPKANVQIALRNPICSANPQAFVMTAMVESLIDDALVEYSYDADIAGLAYSLQGGYTGINVAVSGYNDKMSVLLEKVLHTLRGFDIKEDRFKVIKERMSRTFKNFEYSTPYHQVGQYTRFLGTERAFVYDQLLAEVESITVDDIRAFHALLVSKFHIEMLVHGNVIREDALTITDMVARVLHPRPLPNSQWPIRRSVMLPPGSNYVYERELKDEKNVNHCIQYMLQTGHVADRDARARLLVFAQMTEEPAFNQLRTKEQLGYVVFSGLASHVCTDVYHVLIQSERDCVYLEKRIDAFLAAFGTELRDMSDEKFEGHKRAIINKRLEKLKNLNSECSRFWTHITSEFMHFEAVDDDVARIKKLTKQDLVNFYEQFIEPRSERRTKLSVHLIAKSSPAEVAAQADPAEQKEKLVGIAGQLFSQLGVDVSAAEVKNKIDELNLMSPSIVDDITGALVTLLKSVGDATDEELTPIGEQIKAALGPVLPSLGIVARPTGSEEMGGEISGNNEGQQGEQGEKSKIEEVVETSQAVKIEDVHKWKASQPLSTGATSLRDLSEFEDAGSKL